MDREELTPDLDAKEALSAFRGASWTQKPDAHSCLASFSAALQEKGLIGLTSATFSHAHEFIRSAYEKISEKVANQYRNILSSFFRSRGDLKPNETFASVKEIIQEKEPTGKIQRHFAKSETQAKKAVGMIHRAGLTRSVGTENTYRDCLKVFCDFIKQNQLGDLKNVISNLWAYIKP